MKMKKRKNSFLIVFSVAAMMIFASCGTQKVVPEKNPASERSETVQAAAEVAPQEVLPAEASNGTFAAEFTDQLFDMQQNYRGGTAGCSLRAAAIAAKMMDVFTVHSPSSELIRNTVTEFYGTLSGDAAAEFPSQLEDIVSSASGITGENGKDLLDSCGYTGQGYPWDAAKMDECFAAVRIGE